MADERTCEVQTTLASLTKCTKVCVLADSRKLYNISNTYSTRCNVTQFILSGNCFTCFGWYLHPSSGTHTTVSTASGICHAVTAICRYRGIVGTGLSVLGVAYATHNTLKPVPTLPQ
jgi:hypothetical protein